MGPRDGPESDGIGVWKRVAIGAACAIVYFLTNPGWYGDSPWYAGDIEATSHPWLHDSGHLLWRPLGYAVWRSANAVLPSVGAFAALRALSASFTAAMIFAAYRLAARAGLGGSAARNAALLVGLSHVAIAYGGSGCSYTAAAMFGIMAVSAAVEQRAEGNATSLARAIAYSAAAWTMWGTAVILVPVVGVAVFLRDDGPVGPRLRRATVATLGAGAAQAAVAWFYFVAFVSGSGAPPFLQWLRASGHGLDPRPSVMGTIRAAYGLLVGLLYLDDLGTSIKGVLLRDPTLINPRSLWWSAAAAAMLVAVIAIAVRRVIATAQGRRIVAIGTVCIASNAAFAVLWQGSDVERFIYAMPFLCLVLGLAMSPTPSLAPARSGSGMRWKRLAMSVVALFVVANVGLLAAPSLVMRGGTVGQLARAAESNMTPRDIVLVAGQRISAHVWAPAGFLSHRQIVSVSYDVQQNGADGWDSRLRERLGHVLSAGGRVFVVSDFVGRSTPGGIMMSSREMPVPSLEHIEAFFRTWTPGPSWNSGEITFVGVEPAALRDPPKTPDVP